MSKSLEKSIEMLQRIATGRQTLAMLSQAIDVHKSTALRLLQTLESYGFVTHDEQHCYRLGYGLYALAREALESIDLRACAEPTLRRLNDEVGHTVHLAALHGDQVIYLDKFEGRNGVRMYSRIGLPAPIQSAAVVKSILAFERPDVAERLLGGVSFEKVTPTSIGSIEEYQNVLESVRRNGYAVDNSELEELLKCVGAPIFGPDQTVLGAVSVTVATSGPMREVLKLVPRVKEASAEITRRLGASDDADN